MAAKSATFGTTTSVDSVYGDDKQCCNEECIGRAALILIFLILLFWVSVCIVSLYVGFGANYDCMDERNEPVNGYEFERVLQGNGFAGLMYLFCGIFIYYGHDKYGFMKYAAIICGIIAFVALCFELGITYYIYKSLSSDCQDTLTGYVFLIWAIMASIFTCCVVCCLLGDVVDKSSK
eukprot:195110_1